MRTIPRAFVPRMAPRLARLAKNRKLEADAFELRTRAEERLGELIAEQKATERLNKGAAGGGKKRGPRGAFTEPRNERLTLAEAGISKKLSARAQKLAALLACLTPAARFLA